MSNIRTVKTLLLTLMLSLSTLSIASENFSEYRVEEGDNLWGLCKKFKQKPISCWGTLAKLNKMSNPDSLKPGLTILIPTSWSPEVPAVALVVYTRGEPQLYQFNNSSENYNKPVRLKKHSFLRQQDRITTGKASSTLLLFGDKTEMLVKANSDLILEKLSHDPEKGETESNVLLNKGRISSLVNPNKKKSKFEVRTPFAVAAVRGTEFRVSVGEEGANSEVLEGLVEMNAQEKTVSLAEGFASIVKTGEAPSEPIKLLDPPTIKAMPKTKPSKPLTLQWNKLKGATAYELDLLKMSEGAFGLIENIKLSATKHKFNDLEIGNYQIKLRGIDENNLYGLDSTALFEVKTKPEVTKTPCRKNTFKNRVNKCK